MAAAEFAPKVTEPPAAIQVSIEWSPARICFSNGYVYTFDNPDTLFRTMSFRSRDGSPPNQEVALHGDHTARYMLSRTWAQLDGDIQAWIIIHDQGLATNAFLAYQAQRNGLVAAMERFYGPMWGEGPMRKKEMATTMEALVGAVDVDSKGDGTTVAAVSGLLAGQNSKR